MSALRQSGKLIDRNGATCRRRPIGVAAQALDLEAIGRRILFGQGGEGRLIDFAEIPGIFGMGKDESLVASGEHRPTPPYRCDVPMDFAHPRFGNLLATRQTD